MGQPTDEAFDRAAQRRAEAERQHAAQKAADAARTEADLKTKARQHWPGDTASFEAAWEAGGRLQALSEEAARREQAMRKTAETRVRGAF